MSSAPLCRVLLLSPYKYSVGPLGLYSRLRTRRRWNRRKSRLVGPERSRHGTERRHAATIPHQTFMVYQMMFAVITPALITGAFAERVKFGAFLIFILLWATFIYDPLAHWVWGVKGWMREMGALDFAGGTVVHISSVRRLSWPLWYSVGGSAMAKAMPPHNLPFSVIGAALLWVGWFGFNAGSALAADGLATSAFVATHVATAAAALSWMAMDWIFEENQRSWEPPAVPSLV